MKRIILSTFIAVLIGAFAMIADAGSKRQGEKCFSDSECEFSLRCNDGVCVKKKEFDYGSSGKAGAPCNNDSECINAGKCVRNAYGKGYCSGN